MRTRTDAETPAITTADRQHRRRRRCRTTWARTPTSSRRTRSTSRASRYNRIDAHPAVTSGLKNEDYGINVPQHQRARAGARRRSRSPGSSTSATRSSRSSSGVNEVFQFTDDFTWSRGSHGLKFGADVRKEHMVIAFINRPNGDMTFNGQAASGNAARRFPARLPVAVPPHHAPTRRRTASAGSTPATRRTSGAPSPRVTVNAGVRYELSLPFVDANDALNAFHPGVQSIRFPAAPAGLVYPGDPGVPRGTYATDKNNFAPRLGVGVGSDRATAGPAIRGAWGIFYDALAGQGDFFQNGVLAPPFTPLVEVNSPPATITLANPLNADHRRRHALPAGPDHHRLGRGLPDAVRVPLQPDDAAAGRAESSASRSATSARAAGTCRSSSRSTRVSSRPDRPRRARGSSRRSRWCARRSRSPSPGTTRCRRARGCARPTA